MRVSAGLAAIAGAFISVLLVWFVTLLIQPDPPGALLILSVLVAPLGFILFGIASIRTGVPSCTYRPPRAGDFCDASGSILLVYVATAMTLPTGPRLPSALSCFGGEDTTLHGYSDRGFASSAVPTLARVGQYVENEWFHIFDDKYDQYTRRIPIIFANMTI